MLLSTTTSKLSRTFGDREAIRILAKAGFDAYDYAFYAHNVDDSEVFGEEFRNYFSELKKNADESGIVCNQAHAPLSTSTGDAAKDEEIFRRLIQVMEAASVLGSKIIVVHPKQHLPYGENPELLYELNVEFYRRLVPYCEQFGIKVAAENMWQWNTANRTIIDSTCSRPWEFCKYLDAVDSEWIVGCLDIGHASLVGTDIPEFIRRMGNRRLQALHIHDTDFVSDLHTLPFTQKIDYPAVMEALKEIDYKGDFTYEADGFLKKFPDALLPDVSAFMAKVGRYLLELYE